MYNRIIIEFCLPDKSWFCFVRSCARPRPYADPGKASRGNSGRGGIHRPSSPYSGKARLPSTYPEIVTIVDHQGLASTPSVKKRKEIWDAITLVECFVSYMSVITAYNPARSCGMLAYIPLILRTSRRFSGNAFVMLR